MANIRSRRRFLGGTASAMLASLSGCSAFKRGESSDDGGGGRLGDIREEPQWPVLEPNNKPAIDEIPNLQPPAIGDRSSIHLEIYHELSTRATGSFFDSNQPELARRAEDGEFYLVYRDYVSPVNKWSYTMALGARSIQHHGGVEAFWSFIERLLRDYRPQPHHYMSKERVLSDVEQVGVSPEKVKEDVESWRFYAIVERDTERGKNFGIDGIPAAVVDPTGEQIVRGAAMGNIDSALEQAKD